MLLSRYICSSPTKFSPSYLQQFNRNRWTNKQTNKTDKKANKQTNMTDYPIDAKGAYKNTYQTDFTNIDFANIDFIRVYNKYKTDINQIPYHSL